MLVTYVAKDCKVFVTEHNIKDAQFINENIPEKFCRLKEKKTQVENQRLENAMKKYSLH